MPKRNLSNADRTVRLILSIVLVYLGFIDTSVLGDEWLNLAIGLFGLFNIAVVTVAVCPVYWLAGLSTYRGDDSKRS